jgi:hypothetical protein
LAFEFEVEMCVIGRHKCTCGLEAEGSVFSGRQCAMRNLAA